MSQFTKGKWYADEWDIGRWGVFHGDISVADCWDNEANARLMAEAPTMYDLLNKAFHILGKNTANDEICREIDECLSRIDGVPVQKGNKNNA